MKLLHITATHLNPVGGIPVVLKELITEQNRLENFEARLLSIKADVKNAACQYFDFLNGESLDDYLKKYKPDVVIIHCVYFIEYVKVYRKVRKCNIPYFIQPHGSFMRAALEKSKVKKYIANRTIFRQLIKNAQGYIYLCEDERKKSFYHKEKDLIIPNGIRYFELSCEKYLVPKFYYIGRYDIHEKGLDLLLDALEELDSQEINLEFVFFGNGSDKAIKYLDERIKKFKTIRVRNNGPIYGKEKDKILSQYNIMVLLSRHEGFPMTILEAWNMGNPCIVTEETNVSGVVEDNALGWVTKPDKKSVCSCIKQSLADYEKNKREYITNCNNYVKENYQWDQMAKISKEQLVLGITKLK